MEYLDFTLRISSGGTDGFRVVVDSPEGSCDSTFSMPTGWRGAGSTDAVTRAVEAERVTSTGSNKRVFGAQLYRALFHGEAKTLLDRTTAVADMSSDTGVRIRLSMDLASAGMSAVASLPWELMTTSENEPPLVMSNKTVLVRSFNVMKRRDRIAFKPPLRILAVVSNPNGTTALKLDEERRRVTASWGTLPGVRVTFVEPVVSSLLRHLARYDPHVIHYMGHGDIDSATDRGVLLFQKEDGSPDPVDGERLQVFLRDEPQLRLVVLNACKTATNSTGLGVNPFGGVAASLLNAGVPAVVAMQYEISDNAAINFADTFYQRVAEGFPVEGAVAEARKAMWGGEKSEWATPVLFLRASDGVLFTAPDDADDDEPDEEEADIPDVLSVAGASRDASSDTRAAHVPESASHGAFRVFLATPEETLKSAHRQLASELRARGIQVAEAVPPPYPATEHEALVQARVAEADLCVHLLGDRSGEPLEDGAPGQTYPLEQLRIGLESARSQLVLIPEQADLDNIADKEYAAFIRTVMGRPRTEARLELVRTGQRQMVHEVVEKRRRLEEAVQMAQTVSASGGAVRTAFVDLHSTDLTYATDLINYLGSRKITPIMMPACDDSPTSALSVFESNLTKVPLFIVVFGKVTRAWVVNRLAAAAQFVTTHNATTRIGVYLAPPVKGADQLRFPPFYDMAPNMSAFDPGSIDALIKRAAESMS